MRDPEQVEGRGSVGADEELLDLAEVKAEVLAESVEPVRRQEELDLGPQRPEHLPPADHRQGVEPSSGEQVREGIEVEAGRRRRRRPRRRRRGAPREEQASERAPEQGTPLHVHRGFSIEGMAL
jgi:hypothetical protein